MGEFRDPWLRAAFFKPQEAHKPSAAAPEREGGEPPAGEIGAFPLAPSRVNPASRVRSRVLDSINAELRAQRDAGRMAPADASRLADALATRVRVSLGDLDACSACLSAPDADGIWRFGDEHSFDFEVSPRPVELETPHHSPAEHPGFDDQPPPWSCVLSRFEAVAPNSAPFKKATLVVGLWPLANGWVDAIPFRGSTPESRGRTQWTTLAPPAGWVPGVASPSTWLHAGLAASDALSYDPYLTSKKHLVAGRFLMRSFAPASGKVRFYRAEVAGRDPAWVFGLCQDFEAAERWLLSGANLKVLEKAAATAPPPKERGGWSKAERQGLEDVASSVAFLAARFSLAGYRERTDRVRGAQDGHSVLEYAKHTAMDMALTWMRGVEGDDARSLRDEDQ